MAYPISDVPRRIVYSGSAGVGPYAFTFEVLANTDIAVYKNSTLLTLTTDYTVTINTGTGTGTVTLVVAATGADTVTIVGDRAIRRTSDFVTGGDLFANTLNEELDAQTIYTQQVDEKADRSIKIPVTDPTNLSMTLPSQAARAQKLLGFNASGEPTAYVATTTVSDTSLINFTQSGTGAVTRTAQSKMRDVVSVKDFGAVGDGVTDDTAAIQAALNYCQTNGFKLIGAPGTYKISSTLNIVCDADLGEMLISCPGATVSPAVRIGTTTGTSSAGILDLQVVAPKVNNSSKTGLGWSGFVNSVGIELANLYTSQITIGYVFNFGIGVRVGGYTQGCAYNNVYLGVLFDNKISLLLQRQSVSGFSNQNTYYGGQYGKSGAEGTLIAGAYAIFCDASTNNNTFINPSVETEGDLYQFYFRDSSFNTIINPRFEVADGGRVAFDAPAGGGGVDSNLFINGYSFNPPNFSYAGANAAAIVNNKFIGQKYGDYLGYGSRGIAISNVAGDSSASPHLTGYTATAQLLSKNSASATDYAYKVFADGLLGKRSTDAHPRISIDWYSGKIKLGDGSNALASGGFTSFPSLNWVVVDSATAFTPIPDNSTTLGTSSYRWSTVYAATGTINTSDEREKQDIANLSVAERRVAVALKGLVKKFRFKDAVQAKGDGARIHVGVIAQEVIAAFAAEGLDPMRYAIVCYDEWDAMPEELGDNGEILRAARSAGNRYGIRYDQLLAFIIAAL